MVIRWVVAVVLLAGCQEPATLAPDAELAVDAGMAMEDQQGVLEAVSEYGRATRGRIALRPFLQAPVRDWDRVSWSSLGDRVLGMTLRESAGVSVLLSREALEGAVNHRSWVAKTIALHELAHAFGLSEEEVTVPRTDCLDAGTVGRVCARIGCPDGYEGTCPE
jgi:hypothetical protein